MNKTEVFKVACCHCKKVNESKVLNPDGPDNHSKSFRGQEIYATCQYCNRRYSYISPEKEEAIHFIQALYYGWDNE